MSDQPTLPPVPVTLSAPRSLPASIRRQLQAARTERTRLAMPRPA